MCVICPWSHPWQSFHNLLCDYIYSWTYQDLKRIVVEAKWSHPRLKPGVLSQNAQPRKTIPQSNWRCIIPNRTDDWSCRTWVVRNHFSLSCVQHELVLFFLTGAAAVTKEFMMNAVMNVEWCSLIFVIWCCQDFCVRSLAVESGVLTGGRDTCQKTYFEKGET